MPGDIGRDSTQRGYAGLAMGTACRGHSPSDTKAIDFKKGMGKFESIAFCFFLRGLAFYDKYAFVGLLSPRYKRFEGLELDVRLKQADSEPWTGIHLVDLEKRSCVDWFRIDGAVAELYDVAVVPHSSRPMAISSHSPEAPEHHLFVFFISICKFRRLNEQCISIRNGLPERVRKKFPFCIAMVVSSADDAIPVWPGMTISATRAAKVPDV